MKGKVIDKGSKALIPGVAVILTDAERQYVGNGEGILGTETNSKGVWEFDLAPGQFLTFEFPGYPRTRRSYEQLAKNGDIVLDDASGTALEKKEVNAYVKDMRKLTSGQYLVGIGVSVFLILIFLIIAKKFSWL